MRRYKTGLNLLYDNASTRYCRDGGMDITLRVTNPTRLSFTTEYSADLGTTWQTVDRTISGLVIHPDGAAWIPSGTNNMHINMTLPGPTYGGMSTTKYVRVKVRMVPQDETPGTPPVAYQIDKTYQVVVVDQCNSGGGCPYVYVDNGQGLQLDNNILHRSEFPENLNSDIVDHYKLNIAPVFDPNTNLCTIQLKELNNDIDYFDQVRLLAEDHPIGTNLTVTENQDIVLYFPHYVINPDTAFWNYDSIVTCSLAYDSTCPPVISDSGSTITSTYQTGLYKKSNIGLQILKTIQYTSKKVLSLMLEKYKNTKNTKDFNLADLVDSVGIIFDPVRDNIIPTPKTEAGILIGYDRSTSYNSGIKSFARRENRSVVAVPVSDNTFNIDSVYTKWYRDYSVSFLCSTPLYYGGYLENELQLVNAQHSTLGDVTRYLSSTDKKYAIMDSSSTITLQFNNTFGPVLDGWTRDYVLVVNGRYTSQSGLSMSRLNSNANQVPRVFALHQNYPNPFNPVCIIKYDIPKDSRVTIKVYDVLGKEVKTLVEETVQAGYHEAIFNGSNFASGVYFYRIEAGDFVDNKKMVLIK